MLLAELKDYGKALRPEERKLLEEVLREPLKHVGSISYASSIHVWSFLLLSVVIEQQKRIKKLEDQRAYARMAGRHLPQQEQAHPLAENP